MKKGRQKRFVMSLFLTLCMVMNGICPFAPFMMTAYAQTPTETTTITSDGNTDGTATMAITLKINDTSAEAAHSMTITLTIPGGGDTPTPTPTPIPTPTPTPTPTPAPTENYTVPVETTEGTAPAVNVEATIKDNTATISEIKQEDVNKATETLKDGETTSLVIDLSKAKASVDSVELTKTTVETIAKAAADETNAVDSATIKLPTGEIELDSQATQSVAEQAEGNTVKIELTETKSADLTTAQQETLKKEKLEGAKVIGMSISSGGKAISEFGGGKAKVSVPDTAPQGKDPNYYHVYYLSPLGDLIRMITAHTGSLVKYLTGHNSEYVVVYDETDQNENIAPLTSASLNKTRLTYNGKTRKVEVTEVQAASVDEKAVPESAYTVTGITAKNAGTYTVTLTANEGSGFRGSTQVTYKIVKGKTTFTAKATRKSVKAEKLTKDWTTSIKISKLSKGSSKPTFKIASVSNKMKKYVSISKNGKVTIQKGCKKCKIKITVTSKANKNRKALTRIITITVK